MPTDPTTGQFREPTNADKAEFARQALEAYNKLTAPTDALREDDEDGAFYPALDDLLADLHHLVGIDRMDDALDRARMHYREEATRATLPTETAS